MKIEKCIWPFETLQKQGKIEGKEMDEHRKSCPICKEEARKRLKSVQHSYPLETGWEEPKCPFCFSEIIKPGSSFQYFEGGAVNEAGEPVPAGNYQTGYKNMTCPGCGAIYSYDPDSDSSEDLADAVGLFFKKEDYELTDEERGMIDTFIYHNYDYDSHAFNNLLSSDFDILEDYELTDEKRGMIDTFIYHNYDYDSHAFNNLLSEDNGTNKLGHLWFIRKREKGKEPLKEPWLAGAVREEIRQVIEILRKTKGAFKSKLVEEARERLMKII